MKFHSPIFFNDIDHGYKAALLKKNSLWLLSIYMNMASYWYYEKGRRTNACSLSIFIFFSAPELNNIDSEDELFAKAFSCEESDFWNSDNEYI